MFEEDVDAYADAEAQRLQDQAEADEALDDIKAWAKSTNDRTPDKMARDEGFTFWD